MIWIGDHMKLLGGGRVVAPLLAALFASMTATRAVVADQPAGANPGTPGHSLPGLPAPHATLANGEITLALLGDLAPVDRASTAFLDQAIRDINLLRPAAAFTVGNLVPGLTRNTQRYAEEADQLRATLQKLSIPWFPCAGTTDVASGLWGDEGRRDRRFEALYQQKFGPLYYSTDVGVVHVIVLDSEEPLGAPQADAHDAAGSGRQRGISDEQIAWLRSDLNKTFERSRAAAPTAQGPRFVIVLLHRPLWRTPNKQSPWDRIHRMLLRFNERPIVSVEGEGGGSNSLQGPRVVGVYAGDARAYSKEPTRDGIRYTVLGATAARINGDPSAMLRHITLLKFEPDDAGANGRERSHGVVYPSLVQLFGSRDAALPPPSDVTSIAAILPDDAVTSPEREVLDQIAALPSTVMGIDGLIEESPAPTTQSATTAPAPSNAVGTLTARLANPLAMPLDVELRLAPAPDAADSWDVGLPPDPLHLGPGARKSLTLQYHGMAHGQPPQVDFVVHWHDPRAADGQGVIRKVVLKRRIPVVPRIELPVVSHVQLDGEDGWRTAVGGGAFSWQVREDDLPGREPEWQMIADADRLFLRVRVEDGVKSYWPAMEMDPATGALPSDAVNIAWLDATSKNDAIRRIWILPFGPKGVELWQNRGVGPHASPLQPLPAEQGVTATLQQRIDGYTVTLSLPRTMISDAWNPATTAATQPAPDIRMNITVNDNDEGLQTWLRSWCAETPFNRIPACWGHVTLASPLSPETQPGASPR